MALSTGTRLGPYEILAPLGAGGMGEVYRARDTRLERTVAVKVLNSNLSVNPELKQRFEREARAVSTLLHPHICVLHDIGHQDGTDFLVMEYLEGETLSTRLKRGPLPMGQFWKIAIAVADALDKTHRASIVHRDLKPGRSVHKNMPNSTSDPFQQSTSMSQSRVQRAWDTSLSTTALDYADLDDSDR